MKSLFALVVAGVLAFGSSVFACGDSVGYGGGYNTGYSNTVAVIDHGILSNTFRTVRQVELAEVPGFEVREVRVVNPLLSVNLGNRFIDVGQRQNVVKVVKVQNNKQVVKQTVTKVNGKVVKVEKVIK